MLRCVGKVVKWQIHDVGFEVVVGIGVDEFVSTESKIVYYHICSLFYFQGCGVLAYVFAVFV